MTTTKRDGASAPCPAGETKSGITSADFPSTRCTNNNVDELYHYFKEHMNSFRGQQLYVIDDEISLMASNMHNGSCHATVSAMIPA